MLTLAVRKSAVCESSTRALPGDQGTDAIDYCPERPPEHEQEHEADEDHDHRSPEDHGEREYDCCNE